MEWVGFGGARGTTPDSVPSFQNGFAAELCGGTFIDEVWSEMPEEWTDAGSVVLPLSSIRKSLEESTHVGNVL